MQRGIPEDGKAILALFDFDGTVTTKDTLFLFMRFIRGRFILISGILALTPVFILYFFRLIPNWRAKEIMLRLFIANMEVEKFRRQADVFAEKVLPAVIRSRAYENMKDHLRKGHKVVVVTASAEDWVEPWCRKNGIECIATQLETRDGKLTGYFKGRNCHGIEKVRRIKAYLNPAAFAEIYAYGDSKGDLPMLQMATFAYYKYF